MINTMIAHNDIFVTRSGRHTEQHPKIYKSANRMLKAHREWLKNEGITEATKNKDDYNLILCQSLNPNNWSQADQELTLLYVFGDVTELTKANVNTN